MFLERYSQYAIPLILAVILVSNDVRLFMYANIVHVHLDNGSKEINVRSPLFAYFLVMTATFLIVAQFVLDFKLFANYNAICESILQFLFGMFVFEFVTQFFWNPIEYFTYHTLPKTVEKLSHGDQCLFNYICIDDCTPYTLFLYAVSWFLFYCSLKCSHENNRGSTVNSYSATEYDNFHPTNGSSSFNHFNNVNLPLQLQSISDQQKGTRMCDISRRKQHNESPTCNLKSCSNKSNSQKSKKRNNSTKRTTKMMRSQQSSPRKRCMTCI